MWACCTFRWTDEVYQCGCVGPLDGRTRCIKSGVLDLCVGIDGLTSRIRERGGR
jgi:hypothetical protein